MKKLIIHFIPVGISFLWLGGAWGTFNAIAIKGPEFLKFYIMLIVGFYISIFILKFLKETTSKTTFYFMVFILIIGIVKLIKGVMMGKPVGYLVLLLIIEGVVILCQPSFKHKRI